MNTNIFEMIERENIVSVEVVFDNTASVLINSKLLKGLTFDIKKDNADRDTTSNERINIPYEIVADNVRLVLSKKANKKYNGFDSISKKETVFDRLFIKDITYIEIKYYTFEDDFTYIKQLNIFVPFEETGWFEITNENQINNIDDNGNMIINVSSKVNYDYEMGYNEADKAMIRNFFNKLGGVHK